MKENDRTALPVANSTITAVAATSGRVRVMDSGVVLGGFLCVIIVAVAVECLIGAVFLRAACALFNRLTGGKGSPRSVPEPPFGDAVRITFVTTLVRAVVVFLIGYLVVLAGAAAGSGERGPTLAAQLLSLPIDIFVMASMNAALLPTTFTRGLLVALCWLLVLLFVVVVLAVIFGGVFLAISLLG
jgi:hypothetical protein